MGARGGRCFGLVIFFTALFLLAAYASPASLYAATWNVDVADNKFVTQTSKEPADIGTTHITIDQNDTIVWTWVGRASHSVTTSTGSAKGACSSGADFDSGSTLPPFTYNQTFANPSPSGNDCKYYCTVHASAGASTGMIGFITIVATGPPPPPPPGGAAADSSTTGFFDADAAPDLVVASGATKKIQLYPMTVAGTFVGGAPPVPSFTMTDPYIPLGIAAGRFNSDSFDDIVLLNRISDTDPTTILSIYYGDGAGHFPVNASGVGTPSSRRYIPNPDGTPATITSVTARDIDGDGRTDLVVTIAPGSAGGDPEPRILMSNGDGTFTNTDLFVEVATLTVSPATSAVEPGQQQQFTAVAKDSSGTVISGLTFHWSSSNVLIATVDSAGLATGGTTAGTADIKAQAINRTGTAKLTVVTSPTKNLTAVSISVTAGAASFSITDSVKNNGNVKADQFSVGYYLTTSSVAVNPATDAPLVDASGNPCTRIVTDLQPGQTSTSPAATVCYIPATLAPGSYFVGLYDDATNVIPETNEGDNTKVSTATYIIGPDLVVTLFSAGITGSTITLNDAVKNQGNQPAGPFTIGYYFSTDTFVDAGDTFICSRSVAGLDVGMTDPATGTTPTSCAIPPTITPGPYYTLAFADSGLAVTESRENNNVKYVTQQKIGPDLIPTALTAASSGANLVLNDAVKNQGNVDTGTFAVSFYLSADTLYQVGTDTLICSRTVASLAAGASDPATGSTTTTCPVPPIAPGFYYVLVVDDSGNAVVESTETNNVKASTSKLGIGPDLIPTAMTATSSGANLVLSDSVKNQGNVDATAFSVDFYISADTVYQAGVDTLICSRGLTALAAGTSDPATGTATTTCPVPPITPGSYYILAVDDSANAVAESTETNNTKATTSKMNIGPDLTLTALTASMTAGNIAISDTTKNQGNVDAGTFTVRFYLSTDSVYQVGVDTFVCERTLASLGAGISDSATTTCAPPPVAPGLYYVVAAADEPNIVAESLETNNTRSTTSRITVGPDLIPTAVTVAKSGSTLTLTDSVKNQGTLDAGAFDIGFYLSTDLVFSPATDILICSRTVGSLATGASDPPSGATTTICTVPATAPAGTYRVIVVDDSGGTVTEVNETNNTKYTSNTITVP